MGGDGSADPKPGPSWGRGGSVGGGGGSTGGRQPGKQGRDDNDDDDPNKCRKKGSEGGPPRPTVARKVPRKSGTAYPPINRNLCTVPLSLFADPERILRRLYIFAEEPCKSTTTTSELCNPVFKEVQPRPSEHSNLEYHINNLNLYLYVFGLFSIFVIKPIQPDCVKIKGISVLLLETPLTRSKYFSPFTHAQHLTRTSGTFCTFTYKQTLHWWRI